MNEPVAMHPPMIRAPVTISVMSYHSSHLMLDVAVDHDDDIVGVERLEVSVDLDVVRLPGLSRVAGHSEPAHLAGLDPLTLLGDHGEAGDRGQALASDEFLDVDGELVDGALPAELELLSLVEGLLQRLLAVQLAGLLNRQLAGLDTAEVVRPRETSTDPGDALGVDAVPLHDQVCGLVTSGVEVDVLDASTVDAALPRLARGSVPAEGVPCGDHVLELVVGRGDELTRPAAADRPPVPLAVGVVGRQLVRAVGLGVVEDLGRTVPGEPLPRVVLTDDIEPGELVDVIVGCDPVETVRPLLPLELLSALALG